MGAVLNKIRNEPVRAFQLVSAALAAFGLLLFTDAEAGAIVAVIAFLFGGGEVVRSQTFSRGTVEAIDPAALNDHKHV